MNILAISLGLNVFLGLWFVMSLYVLINAVREGRERARVARKMMDEIPSIMEMVAHGTIENGEAIVDGDCGNPDCPVHGKGGLKEQMEKRKLKKDGVTRH